jgi:hypothetical protein
LFEQPSKGAQFCSARNEPNDWIAVLRQCQAEFDTLSRLAGFFAQTQAVIFTAPLSFHMYGIELSV